MKKIIATVCILGSAALLSACETDSNGYRDLEPPYEQGRTVGTSPAPVAKTRPAPVREERVFRQQQTK